MKEIKKALRKAIKSQKAIYSAKERNTWDAALWRQLERHPRFISSRTVLMYCSLPDEVDTHEFIEQWKEKKSILLPVVKGDELELRLYTGKEDLKVGAYNIEEPVGEPFTDYSKIDVAVIPGVAFDKEGNRLGRGKGYYDRLLPKLTSYNIGVCYDFQVVDKVPCETFDKKMDAVLTNSCWISET